MKTKLIASLLIVFSGIFVLIISLSSIVNKSNKYEGYLAKARANADNLVPYTSCQNYVQAFDIKCEDEEIYKEYVEQAKILGDTFYDEAIENYRKYFPKSTEAYELLCDQYYVEENYKKVMELALEARELNVATEKIRDMYFECIYMYKTINSGFEEVTSFLGNYAVVKSEGLYGYLDGDGSYLISPQYKDANIILDANTAVNDGTEWFFINKSGYKVARPSEPVDDLSILSNGKIRVGKENKYGYTNTSFKYETPLPYDFASNFKNGIAAVKKGEKWALIDTNENNITDFIYDEIVLDEFETCISNNVIFVKENNKYYMINSEGEKIIETGYDAVSPFVGTEPAAVCINGKWGFVDGTGKDIEINIPQVKEAKSFSCGLAAVKENDTWGYIDLSGNYRLESVFSDCLPFSEGGIAAVKENDAWNFIKLLPYCD